MSIEKQILFIKNEIKGKADLVAVSKTRSIQEIQEAYNSGQLKFGENRVQEIVFLNIELILSPGNSTILFLIIF